MAGPRKLPNGITKLDNGKYRARYRDPDGREHCRHFGRLADAEDWLDTAKGDMVRGTYISPTAGQVSFKTYAEEWRKDQAQHAPSTVALTERHLRLHVYPTLGARPLAAIRRSEIQSIISRLSKQEHKSPSLVLHVYSTINSIFKTAVAEKERPDSPCVEISLPKVVKVPVVPPTRDVVERIIDAAPEGYQALIIFAWLTGLRQGELFGLTTERLDFLRREVRVDQQLVYISGQDENGQPNRPYLTPVLKTPNSYRTVPAPTAALNAMAQHMAKFPPGPGGLLFTSIKRHLPVVRTTYNGIWKHALVRAGVDPEMHFHHLRHAYVSLLIEGGESPKVVAERIGDTVTEVWNTYAHLWPTSDEKTRAILDRAVAGPASTQSEAVADSVRTGGYLQAADQGK